MTEQEYIGPMLDSLNGIAVDKAMRGEIAKNGKSDARSHFEDEVEQCREIYRKNVLAKPQDIV